MASSFRSLAFAAGLLAACVAFAQSGSDRRLPIVMDASHSELDLATNRTIFHRLRITQGATRIEAERAETSSGTSFADSEWQFSGNVEIDVNSASIRAERATLKFLNFDLTHARVSGTPATFRDTNVATGATTSGAAEQFEYDLAGNVVRFENNARIANADNEVTGRLLIYNVLDRQVVFEGDETTGERVRITVQPPADTGRDDAEQLLEGLRDDEDAPRR